MATSGVELGVQLLGVQLLHRCTMRRRAPDKQEELSQVRHFMCLATAQKFVVRLSAQRGDKANKRSEDSGLTPTKSRFPYLSTSTDIAAIIKTIGSWSMRHARPTFLCVGEVCGVRVQRVGIDACMT